MTEISSNVLDVAENFTRAGTKLVTITVAADLNTDRLTIIIEDDGCGMNEEQIKRVTSPFFTSRAIRRMGFGVPFFKYVAENIGGSFAIESQVGIGTTVITVFVLSHVSCMPLGDISSTIHTLIVCHLETESVYHHQCNDNTFTLDTREFREMTGDIPPDTLEISSCIMKYPQENKLETDGGTQY